MVMTISSACSRCSDSRTIAKPGLAVRLRVFLSFCLAAALVGCGPKAPKASRESATPEVETEATPTSSATARPSARSTPAAKATPTPIPRVPVSTQPPPAELWKEFSGERAWRTAKQLVELGPRPAGSMELGRARGLLVSALESSAWEVEQQPFSASSPQGEISGTNLIARFSADGTRPVPRGGRAVLLGAHYDTRHFTTIKFVGANEGASGPAVLVEIARVLALDPQLAAKIEIVLFDAGEPRSQFAPDDGIFGSKAYAKSATSHPAHVAILQSVGDANSPLSLAPGASAELVAQLRSATTTLKSPLEFKTAPVRHWGDHLPFGTGALVLGNYDSLFRYTADDTIDRVDPTRLQRVGELLVWLSKKWAAGPE